jgi:hypothetical protein
MYTEGITKIHRCRDIRRRFGEACTMAENAGYYALSFNGTIHVRIEEDDFTGWVETCFHLTDFQDVQT